MRRFLALVLTTVLTVGVTSGLAVTMDPQSAAAAPTSSELDSARKTILSQTNAARAGQGLKPLVLNTALNKVAQDWTKKMSDAGTMSHNPDFFSQYPAGVSPKCVSPQAPTSGALAQGALLNDAEARSHQACNSRSQVNGPHAKNSRPRADDRADRQCHIGRR